ncbi:MAG: NFYB/HAP3 family transcription factor subunit [Candidatus Aenigmatarchaeota archaeon]
MTKDKEKLPLMPFERILKKAGAKRVSRGAMKEFASKMSDYLYRLSHEAAAMANHAGRKTVLETDVKMARKKVTK